MRLRPQAQCSMFNKLYLPINGRAFWSQSVTLFQKEDVTWQDQKRWISVSEELFQTVQLSFSFRPILSKKSSVGMRLCNSLNWNSISLAGFLFTRIIIIIVILCIGILQGNMIARKLGAQGSQQVSSSVSSAFPIASVAIGVWSSFPDVGDLILMRFYEECPFLVPFLYP